MDKLSLTMRMQSVEDRAQPEAAVVLSTSPDAWQETWDHHLSLPHGPDSGLHPV